MRRLGRNLRVRQLTQAIKNWLSYPDVFAPLTHSLLLTNGQGVATFARATTATCWCYLENAIGGSSQVLQVIPAGTPRFEGARFIASSNTWSNLLSDGAAIPEATLKGVSIEVSSTNRVPYSDDFTNATWTKILATITANQIVAPDGTLTADLVTCTAAGGSYVYANTGNTVGSNTFSIYAKAGNQTKFGLYIGTGGSATYTLSGGGSVDTGTGSIKSVGNGWYSCTVSYTATAGNSGVYRADMATGDTFYIWGAQLEALPMATSYIPTTTAALTRNADVLTFPNAGNVSDSQGTVLITATPAFDIPAGATPGYGYQILLDFGISNGHTAVFNNYLGHWDGSQWVFSPRWLPLKNITYKIAASWGTVGQRNWLNGQPGTNAAFDGSINSLMNMTIGGWGGGTNYNWGGTIKNLKIWKRALSDSDITRGTS